MPRMLRRAAVLGATAHVASNRGQAKAEAAQQPIHNLTSYNALVAGRKRAGVGIGAAADHQRSGMRRLRYAA